MSSFNLTQVVPSLNSGGVERGTVDVANYLADQQIHSSVISNGGIMESELNKKYVNHYKLPIDSKNPLFFFQLSRQIREYIFSQKINLVHVRSRAPAWVINMIKNKNFKTIGTFHNVYGGNFFLKKFYNKGLAKMDYIISISDFVKDEIVKKYNINPNNVETIFRGTDTNFFMNNIKEKELQRLLGKFNFVKNNKIIFYPARITEWKGQLQFLDVAKKIKNKNILICFAGDIKNHSFHNLLERKIKEMNLEATCKIIGNLSNYELKAMYSICDIVLSLPQRPEGFGRVVSEALSMKKMLLAFNYGGVKDQLKNLDNIYKITPLDYNGLEIKIQNIINLSDEEKNNLTNNGRQHIEKFFSIKQMVYNYKKFYESKAV